MAETEVAESRGSFVNKDQNVRVLCDHQTTDEISFQETDQEFVYGDGQFGYEFPVLEIKGRIFSMKKSKKVSNDEKWESLEKDVDSYVKYKLLFDQKNSNQIGFQVELGKPNLGSSPKLSPRGYKGFFRQLSRTRRIRVLLLVSFSKRKRVVTDLSNEEENVAMKDDGNACFNRICLTYSSEKDERFFGFGEQFSHFDFKGRKVPFFIQEQGIGKGDQPITFAANLVSYRTGGDWSTTYAPSPFYMTSKMKSLYLEGYDFSVFDVTHHERVQIQTHEDCFEGRILNGNSPCELIEQFTQSIGRPTAITKINLDYNYESTWVVLNSTENVAKGWIKSLDPNELVGGKEIGPDWCEVNVQIPIKRNEHLVRPYGFIVTVEDAVGATVAWPCPFISVAPMDE